MELPQTIRFEKRDRVAIVTIDRPDALNALTKEMLGGLDAAFSEFNDDDDLWVAILTGAGSRHFCTGFDVGSEDEEETVFVNRPLQDAVFWSPHQNGVSSPSSMPPLSSSPHLISPTNSV